MSDNDVLGPLRDHLQGTKDQLRDLQASVDGLQRETEDIRTGMDTLDRMLGTANKVIDQHDDKIEELRLKQIVLEERIEKVNLDSVQADIQFHEMIDVLEKEILGSCLPERISQIVSKISHKSVLVIGGSNDKEKDSKTLVDMAAAINKSSGSTVIFGGEFVLAVSVVISVPTTLVFGRSIFHVVKGGAFKFMPAILTRGTFRFTGHSGEELLVPSTPTGFKLGDFITVKSDDTIPIRGHSGTNVEHPQEIHRVRDPGNNQLENALCDSFLDNGRGRILNMVDGIIVEGGRFIFEGPFDDRFQAGPICLQFYQCSHVKLWGVTVQGTTGIQFNFCYLVDIEGCSISLSDTNLVYGFTMGVASNVRMRNCTVLGTHHAVTTMGGDSAPGVRWGNVLNFVISDCTFVNPSYFLPDGSTEISVIGDTHAEGYGVMFKDCLFVCATTNPDQQCLSLRSRFPEVNGCTFRGGNGILAWGVGVRAMNNVFEGCTRAIYQYPNPQLTQDNLVAIGNVAIGTKYREMEVYGNMSRICRNDFTKSIHLLGGIDHVLLANSCSRLAVEGDATVKNSTGNIFLG